MLSLALFSACSLSAAEWIAGAYEPPAETNTPAFFEPARNSIVKKCFHVRKAVKAAEWRVAAPGMRDLFVNGERVSATALPPWTPYRERVLEETFDVTSCLKPGVENELAVELGNGWFNPLPLTMWYRYNLREYLATGTPSVRAVLSITYVDGSGEEVATDATWSAFDGRVIHNNLYLGVVEDKRLEVASTGAARVVKGPRGRVCPAGGFPKVVIIGRRTPKSVKALPGGAYLVDFGVNAAGTLKVKLRNVRDGQQIAFRQGERLFDDGTVNTLTAVAGQIKNPQRGPLFAVAEPRDMVICRAAAECVFEPRFTFHVFRYVQVEGLAEAPMVEDFEALDWSAEISDSASFVCSDARINELHAVCRRTFRSNLQSVQSDCPGREKFGYSGDIGCTCEAFCCNYDMAEFYKKTVRDFLDEARNDGLITETAPFVGIASSSVFPPPAARDQPAGHADAAGKARAAPMGWAVGLPILLDNMVRYYGDLETLREAYPALVRFMKLLEKRYPDHLVPRCLGDWCPAFNDQKADERMSAVAYYHQFAKFNAKFARMLGYAEDARHYDQLAAAIAEAWRRQWLKDDGTVARGRPAEQLYGLYHGLVDDARQNAAYNLLKNAMTADGYRHVFGISTTQYLFEYLPRQGEAYLAGRVLVHDQFPGYLDTLRRGATTLWEHMNEDKCLNGHSNCHPMFGSCEMFLLKYVLGIAVADDAIGGDKVRIRPNAVSGITWAKGHLDTPHGRISVSWRQVDGKLIVEKQLPTGVVELP